MEHALVTVAIDFDRERMAAVERALETLGNPAGAALKGPLDDAAFVHFMSITAVPAGASGPAHLVVELNADGTARGAIDRLAAAIGDPLRAVLAAAGADPGDDLARFLASHQLEVGQGWFSTPGLVYDGTPGMSVPQIRDEATLAHKIAGLLDAAPRFPSASAALEQVRDRLWADGEKWAFVAAPAPCLQGVPPAWKALGPALASLIMTFLWPLLLIAVVSLFVAWALFGFAAGAWVAAIVVAAEFAGVVVAYVHMRRLEETDVPDHSMPSAETVAAFMAHENFAVHNHLASASTLKSDRLRYHTLRLGLWYAAIFGRFRSRPSFLGPNGQIHFARWILLPGTDQLLFRSNYDGAWGSYVEDFVEISSRGVNGIWSNTEGFPKTKNLLMGGATNSEALMRWTRRQQRPSHVWYSAYPRLTLARIRTNAAIRQGVALARTEGDASDWLACFGSTPHPVGALEPREMPTLVFGGLSHLRHGTALFVRLAGDPEAGRRWLAGLERELSYGGHRDIERALVLGLTAGGLAKLGFTERHLASFPVAFQHGMAAPWRARALGDTGASDPTEWVWGGPAEPVDALLMVYAGDAGTLKDRADTLTRAARALGHDVGALDLAPLPEKKRDAREPFGFTDGISQPIVRGIGRGAGRDAGPRDVIERDRQHLVEPGEFVLGYPDNFGFVAPSPSVPAADDPAGLLPAAGEDPMRQRPNFADAQPAASHDLGRNGSYLVVRQLEQHVDAFDGFAREAAQALARDPRAPKGLKDPEEWIKAKMVGRWKDGSSLVRHPDAPAGTGKPESAPAAADNPDAAAKKAARADNDFLFGLDDPAGLGCPFGAHVRRTNPRDSFEPGQPRRMEITNRHRILRVGRPYGEKGGKQGLLFMCLNADIERQFEFIQQTWLMGANFHGLENETDPTLGRNGADGAGGTDAGQPRCFTIPTDAGPLRLKGLKDFVTVKGGAYFFLPGRRALHYLAAGGVVAKTEGGEAEARAERKAAE